MDYRTPALLVLLFLLGVFFVTFPNAHDSVSYIGEVSVAHANGFAQYSPYWYAGSPTISIYVLGQWIAYVLSTVLSVPLAYLVTDILAILASTLGAFMLAKELGLSEDKRWLFLLAFFTMPIFFYQIQPDRFPTFVGFAFGLFAMQQAASCTLKDSARLLRVAALLGLCAIASLHTFLLSALVCAVFLLKPKVIRELEPKHVAGIAVAIIVAGLIELLHAINFLQFLGYFNSFFYQGSRLPSIFLSWPGPLVLSFALTLVLHWIWKNDRNLRLFAIGVIIACAAVGLWYIDKHYSLPLTIILDDLTLVGLFSVFLLAGELLNVFEIKKPSLDLQADSNLVIGLGFLAAAVVLSHILPILGRVDPVVYGLFGGLFLSLWFASRVEVKSGSTAIILMALLSIPFVTLIGQGALLQPDSAGALTSFFQGQQAYGRILFDSCPPDYLYASINSHKPMIEGMVLYNAMDRNVSMLAVTELGTTDAHLLQAEARVLWDPEYQVKWVATCNSTRDYSKFGFKNDVSLPGVNVWTSKQDFRLADNANATIMDDASISVVGKPNSITNVSVGYYPALKCVGCTILAKGTSSIQLRINSPQGRAALVPDKTYFWAIAASVALALSVIAASFVLEKKKA